MKKILRIVLVSIMTLLLFSCYYDEFPEVAVIIDPAEDVLFVENIIPIFERYNCVQCHNASRDPDLRPGNEYTSLVPTYVVANNANTSRLYIQLAVNKHREVDATSLALIKEWINRGALPN